MEQSASTPNHCTNEQSPRNDDREDPLSDHSTEPVQSADGQQSSGSQSIKTEVVTSTSPALEAQKSPSPDLSQLGEFVFYKPSSYNTTLNVPEDLPPNFLEPTAEDLRSAQASLASRARAYRDAPLLTEKLRKEREDSTRDKYPTTTIRIKFADRSALEKTFPSSSLIKPVYAFVRACLREDAKEHKFVLFETPPRRDLKVSDPNVRDKTLFDLHLAPRSILYFRFLEESVKLDNPTGPPPLYLEILSQAIEFPQPAPQETSAISNSQPGSKIANPQSAKLGNSSDKERKLARFLKLPGKK